MNTKKWEGFKKKYKPIKNKKADPNELEGYLFGTTKKDIFEVMNMPCFWTVCEYEGKLILQAGMHYVNRLGFFITGNPPDNPQQEINLGKW